MLESTPQAHFEMPYSKPCRWRRTRCSERERGAANISSGVEPALNVAALEFADPATLQQ